MPFPDLRSFVRHLEQQGELRRVKAPVDPELEITEIACRVVREQGPALLFENVAGASFPLLINPFGTMRRIEWALGRPAGEVGRELTALAEDMMPPKPSALWKHRAVFGRALNMRPKRVSSAPVFEVSGAPDLGRLPVLKCWPKDGGKFITLPLVFTQSPSNGKRNVAIYRMHVYGPDTTGMHWQIQKGGGFHYAEAEKLGRPLPVNVVLGADPLLMLSGVLPLPENMDEMAFAGFLRGSPTPLARTAAGSEVPANAEIVLEGIVRPSVRRVEGPFGDHFGHYSHAAPFPVFEIAKFHHRKDALYPAAVVGKPPQEDKYMGNAVQEMLLPLAKLMRPELADLWAYFEAGFHNLAVASVRQRYRKEALKTAFFLLGEGQMSLTKCVILVDPDVNARSFHEVLAALRKNFDPKEDFLLLPGTSQDTLDFTGPAMNLGSKMVLDATSGGNKDSAAEKIRVPSLDMEHRNWGDALLVVKTKQNGRRVVESLVKRPDLAGFKLIAAVSEDVPLNDDELLLWGLFTRFDCARDLVPAKVELRGGVAVYEGPLGLDATWKPGYPDPLVMDPDVVRKVDQRWKEYGI